MTRKLFALAMFAVACGAMMYASSTADAIEEAPAPRPVEEKKPDAKGKFGGFGGFNKGGFGGGKFDPAKLKELQEKFGKGGPGGFGGFGKGGFDKSKIDPEKLKEFKDKFGKGGFGKKKDGDKEEE